MFLVKLNKKAMDEMSEDPAGVEAVVGKDFFPIKYYQYHFYKLKVFSTIGQNALFPNGYETPVYILLDSDLATAFKLVVPNAELLGELPNGSEKLREIMTTMLALAKVDKRLKDEEDKLYNEFHKKAKALKAKQKKVAKKELVKYKRLKTSLMGQIRYRERKLTNMAKPKKPRK